jgi:hypothetical protein
MFMDFNGFVKVSDSRSMGISIKQLHWDGKNVKLLKLKLWVKRKKTSTYVCISQFEHGH